jgi:enoyl-CoA hydratase
LVITGKTSVAPRCEGTVPADAAELNEPPVVLVERHGRTLVITLNRPRTRNAINLAVAERIAAALDELDAETGLAVGVLTGAGGAFSSGMDLKAFATTGERPYVAGRGFAGICEYGARKPLIAAIEGFAVAGGLEVSLACDLIVAARDAKLGIPETKRGLAAGGGGLWRLPRRVPLNVAAEMALTGDSIEAERAHALGLVNVLSEPGGALPAALSLAERIAANGPLALAASKQVLHAQQDWTTDEVWGRQRAIIEPVATSDDAREGSLAFAQKREPKWTGQ